MSEQCSSSTCTAEPDCMVRTYVANRGQGGLVASVYQFPEDAPSSAEPYCTPCAQRLMFNLAGLSNSDKALVLP